VLVVLAALDAGRSLYARLGYARPLAVWQPDRKAYADITWPPGKDLAPGTGVGPRIYAERCAVCHGPDGRGNGPAAPSLIPRPRDFTLGQFKYKSTPAGRPPRDADLIRTVTDGLRASAMPYFGDLLDESEIFEVVRHVKGFSPASFSGSAPAALLPTPRARDDSASRARGRALYAAQGCVTCHGLDGRGMVTLPDSAGHLVVSRDLTAPWTFRGGSTPLDIWTRLTTGLAPGPMPSFAQSTTPRDRWDLVNYVLSLARKAPWDSGGRLGGPGFHANLTRRGEYLVRAQMCGLCHTMINRTGIYRGDDAYLAGGMRVGAWPYGMLVSRNLTGDSATGLGSWTDAEIIDALRRGRARGRVLNMYDMPWLWLHALTDDDATAIARYLKSLPPVRHRIPEPLRYGVVETIASKLTRPLPAVPTVSLTYADGDFGQTGGLPREWPQTLLVGLQWLALLAGVVLVIVATPVGRFFVLKVVFGLLGLVVVGAVVLALYRLPLLRVIPPERIIATATAGLPDPPPAATPEQTALVRRGRYLYRIASCELCHGSNGSGGQKISWRPMGTLWTRNVSSDPETGLARWTDAEISRAIRSGISRNGAPLHWQGMVWDHASNWDEEDIRALIAFLRAMPPVRKRIPADRPPSSDDCEVYTFFTGTSSLPGCR
jgi:mono/diheme cytochrome c family protein